MNYKKCLLWDKWGVIPFFLSQLRSILFHPPKKPECTFALLERFQLRLISISGYLLLYMLGLMHSLEFTSSVRS